MIYFIFFIFQIYPLFALDYNKSLSEAMSKNLEWKKLLLKTDLANLKRESLFFLLEDSPLKKLELLLEEQKLNLQKANLKLRIKLDTYRLYYSVMILYFQYEVLKDILLLKQKLYLQEKNLYENGKISHNHLRKSYQSFLDTQKEVKNLYHSYKNNLTEFLLLLDYPLGTKASWIDRKKIDSLKKISYNFDFESDFQKLLEKSEEIQVLKTQKQVQDLQAELIEKRSADKRSDLELKIQRIEKSYANFDLLDKKKKIKKDFLRKFLIVQDKAQSYNNLEYDLMQSQMNLNVLLKKYEEGQINKITLDIATMENQQKYFLLKQTIVSYNLALLDYLHYL